MNKILKALQGIIAPPLAKIEAQIEHLQGDFDKSNKRIEGLTDKYIELLAKVSNLEGKFDSAVEVVEARVMTSMISRQQEEPPQPPLLKK